MYIYTILISLLAFKIQTKPDNTSDSLNKYEFLESEDYYPTHRKKESHNHRKNPNKFLRERKKDDVSDELYKRYSKENKKVNKKDSKESTKETISDTTKDDTNSNSNNTQNKNVNKFPTPLVLFIALGVVAICILIIIIIISLKVLNGLTKKPDDQSLLRRLSIPNRDELQPGSLERIRYNMRFSEV